MLGECYKEKKKEVEEKLLQMQVRGLHAACMNEATLRVCIRQAMQGTTSHSCIELMLLHHAFALLHLHLHLQAMGHTMIATDGWHRKAAEQGAPLINVCLRPHFSALGLVARQWPTCQWPTSSYDFCLHALQVCEARSNFWRNLQLVKELGQPVSGAGTSECNAKQSNSASQCLQQPSMQEQLFFI